MSTVVRSLLCRFCVNEKGREFVHVAGGVRWFMNLEHDGHRVSLLVSTMRKNLWLGNMWQVEENRNEFRESNTGLSAGRVPDDQCGVVRVVEPHIRF